MAAASPQIHRLELNRQAHHVLNALRCTKRTLLGCGAIQAFADVAAHAIPARYAREDIASEALLRLGFRRYGNRNVRQPPSLARRRTLKLRGGPGANPTLTLQESPARPPEPVRTAEVQVRTTVISMARRECHPVAQKSDMPLLFPHVLNLRAA